jgi:hypothetical protein
MKYSFFKIEILKIMNDATHNEPEILESHSKQSCPFMC